MSTMAVEEDESFYFHNIIFQAGTTLFNVPVEYLPQGEGVFTDMFALPNVDKEGSSNEKPVILPDQVTAEDFRSLLKVLFPQPRSLQARSMTVTEWSSVLRLCTMWCLDAVRAKAIVDADPQVNSLPDDVELVLLAKEHRISRWLVDGYRKLSRRKTYLTREEQDRVGFETATRLAEVRERSWQWAATTTRETYYTKTSGKVFSAQDVTVNKRSRVEFDFDSAIHDIFEKELELDKEYIRPKPTETQRASSAFSAFGGSAFGGGSPFGSGTSPFGGGGGAFGGA